MKIVVPVSASDAKRLNQWIEVEMKHGNLLNHTISFLPTFSTEDQVKAAAQFLMENGIQAEVLKMQIEPYGGWPMASNMHFYEAVRLMSLQQQPWFWCELDCLRTSSNGWDVAAAGYTSCGTRFFGHVGPAPWRDDATGNITKSPFGEEDTMMSGCGIYPANFPNLPEVAPLLADFVKGGDSAPSAFDVYLRDVIRLNGVANTHLIADHWNTVDYKFDGKNLSCSPNMEHENLQGNTEIRKKGGIVNSQAVIVHGCKDDSLFNLIMDGLDMSTVQAAPQPIIQSTEKVDPGYNEVFGKPDDRMAKLEAENAEMKSMLKLLIERSSELPSTSPKGDDGSKKHPEPSSEEQKPAGFKIKRPSSASEHDRIVECLQNSTKRLRIGDVSKTLDIPLNRLKALSIDPDSKFLIGNGPAGWLSLRDKVKS